MKTVGEYEYDEKNIIGRGAFGIVYKGRNKTNLTQVVAIKEVHVNRRQYNKRLLSDSVIREADILKMLASPRHKNIVALLQWEKQTDYAYFVMEFCNGGSLREYLLTAGLKVAHDMHVIHRDLKPENILLCFSGPKYPSPDRITLKIANFGTGNFLLDCDEMPTRLCGAWLYMAPEILLERPFDYKVDLWYVGIIAHECLGGSWSGTQHISIKGVEYCNIISTNISPNFADLLNGLLEGDENKRINTEQFLNHRFLSTAINTIVLPSDGLQHLTVGDYEYDEKNVLGEGMFAKVYKGRSKKDLNMVVAVKDVDLTNRNVKQSPDSPTREIEILKALSKKQHKNIVTLLHCERQTRNVYLVLEFCNGGSLREYLEKKKILNESTIRTFLQQIAAGLKAAHEMQIIHRDLKPENILLCFSGSDYPSPLNITLKIADFGIGRFLNTDEMARSGCGTPLYTAPEIYLQRPGGYEYKADLWSVGVIAYECLVGSLQNNSLICLHGVERGKRKLIRIPKQISPDFANLLDGLLERNENKRFDMKQFFNHQFLAAKKGVIPEGFQNYGNTSYFNSVLQCLLQTVLLPFELTVNIYGLENVLTEKDEIYCLSKAFMALASKYNESEQRNGSLKTLYSTFTTATQRYNDQRQHDSHDLLIHFLDKLRVEERNLWKIPSASPDTRKMLTAVDRIFGGQFITVYTCHSCEEPRAFREPFLDISIPLYMLIPDESHFSCETNLSSSSATNDSKKYYSTKIAIKTMLRPIADEASAEPEIKSLLFGLFKSSHPSISQCLKYFTRAKLIEDDYPCRNCQKRDSYRSTMTSATKRTLISSPPAILVLHLKRFEQKSTGFVKRDEIISYDELMDVGPFCSISALRIDPEEENVWYSLYAVVVHHGLPLSHGYCVAYVKQRDSSAQIDEQLREKFLQKNFRERHKVPNDDNTAAMEKRKTITKREKAKPPPPIPGQWFYINDDSVRSCDAKEALDQKAYMLFYERIPCTDHKSADV